MPQFKDAPPHANEIMESVYSECRKQGMSKKRCSIKAVGIMKKSYKRDTSHKWHKKGK